MASTYTWCGVTVTTADAQRVAAYVKSLPAGPVGEAKLQWEFSGSNPTGKQFMAAMIFAWNLGLLAMGPTTNAAGQQIGSGIQNGTTWFSYIAPNIQTPQS